MPTYQKNISKSWNCIHDRGAMKWDSWDRVFKCQRCGQVFVPLKKYNRFQKLIKRLLKI